LNIIGFYVEEDILPAVGCAAISNIGYFDFLH